MADEVSIDKATFHNRLSAFISQWKQDKRNGDTLFAGASSIAIVMGKSDESQGFTKTSAMQFWLLGYEFPHTLFILTPDLLQIVPSAARNDCRGQEQQKPSGLHPLPPGRGEAAPVRNAGAAAPRSPRSAARS